MDGNTKLSSPFDFLSNIGVAEKGSDVVDYARGPLFHGFIGTLWVLGVIALVFGIYFYTKANKLTAEHKAKVRAQIEHRKNKAAKPHTHLAWENIIDNLNSPNESGWRLAVMDSDSLLDAMLTDLGYTGVGVGEKLKSVPHTQMRSLDLAWEAHKVRNKIAHDGSNFPVSQREARRIVYLYETVFREFGYI